MPDIVAFRSRSRSRSLIVTSAISVLDLTDDETAAIFASQIAHIITNHDEAVRSANLLLQSLIPPIFTLLLVTMYLPQLWFCALATSTTLAIKGLPWPMFGDKQAEEAIKIGMLLMSEEGFDPAAAVSVEYKMADVVKRLSKTGKKGRMRGCPVSIPEAIYAF